MKSVTIQRFQGMIGKHCERAIGISNRGSKKKCWNMCQASVKLTKTVELPGNASPCAWSPFFHLFFQLTDLFQNKGLRFLNIEPENVAAQVSMIALLIAEHVSITARLISDIKCRVVISFSVEVPNVN